MRRDPALRARSIIIVSAGPTRYGSVVLPDQVVIDELESRGTVYRTDRNDETCGQIQAKIGPDNDSKPGGCDNIRITVSAGNQLTVEYFVEALNP